MTDTYIQTKQILSNWSMPVVGYGRMITEPLLKNGWYLVPLEKYAGIIPKLAIETVEQIKQSGVEIEGVVVAYKENQPPAVETPSENIDEIVLNKVAEFGKSLLPVAKEIGKVVITVAGAIGVVLGVILIVGLAGVCLSNDPVLIVVLKDGTWVEVARW